MSEAAGRFFYGLPGASLIGGFLRLADYDPVSCTSKEFEAVVLDVKKKLVRIDLHEMREITGFLRNELKKYTSLTEVNLACMNLREDGAVALAGADPSRHCR